MPDQVISAVGLTTAEARSRLTEQGANAVQTHRRVRLIRRLGNQLKDPLLLLLIAAVVLTISVGDFTDAVVIAMVIVVNTTVGVIQEVRADRAVTALATLSAPRARVIRDGRQTEIPAADVVPGDALVLAEGDLVAADAELVESAALLVDESSVTGESVPVDKAARSVDRAADDHLAAGTVVVRGRGVATVTATGASSTVGRMAALLDAGPQLTPLQRRLRGLSRVLAIIVAILCIAVGIIGLIRGQPLELMTVTGDQPRGCRRTRVVAHGDHLEPRPRRPADGRQACDRSSLAGGGDARLGVGDRHGQDRNDHRRPYGGAASLDSLGGGGDRRHGLQPRWRRRQ